MWTSGYAESIEYMRLQGYNEAKRANRDEGSRQAVMKVVR